MSKELTALEAAKDIRECLFWSDEGLKKIDIIETALKELNDIKSGKIRLSVNSGENYVAIPKYQYERDLKELKALKIIKTKKVHVRRLFECKTLDEYNDDLQIRIIYRLTEQEYNLLKEILP